MSIIYLTEHDLLIYSLLPLKDLQPEKRYTKSIPGDIPKLNILDETCNMDIHESARYHISIAGHLAADDPRKISFATPKEI
jgi:hypothetical protein